MSEGEVIARPGTDLAVPGPDALDARAIEFQTWAKAESTKKAYIADCLAFATWCEGQGVSGRPADANTVTRYLTYLADLPVPPKMTVRSVATLSRVLAAIGYLHLSANLDNPCASGQVKRTLSGIRRQRGMAQTKKAALTADLVAKVIRKIRGEGDREVRDRALILLAFGAALRRSELVALKVEQLTFSRKGLMVALGKTKTDQEGRGRKVSVLDGKLRAPAAVQAWIKHAGLTAGDYLFPAADRGQEARAHMHPAQFAKILKARVEAAGLDPTVFSGHSPRRGFATSAGDDGADLRLTANHMRHVKLETTMGYMEEGELFRSNPGKGFM